MELAVETSELVNGPGDVERLGVAGSGVVFTRYQQSAVAWALQYTVYNGLVSFPLALVVLSRPGSWMDDTTVLAQTTLMAVVCVHLMDVLFNHHRFSLSRWCMHGECRRALADPVCLSCTCLL